MKFIKATSLDRERIMSLVKSAPETNLFLIGDIEFYGFDNDFQTVYINEGPIVETVVLRYLSNLVIYSSTNQFDADSIREIIDRHQITYCNAPLINARHLYSCVQDRFTYRPTTMARMTSDQLLDQDLGRCQKVIADDIPDIVDAIALIDEFSHVRKEPRDKRIQHVLKKHRDGFALAYIIRENGRVVAHAEATAQSSQAAMIVAVFTLPEYRKLGYASQVVSAVCRDLLSRNRRPVLFFDNPKAAAIYHRLGFVDFDTWVMMPLKEQES